MAGGGAAIGCARAWLLEVDLAGYRGLSMRLPGVSAAAGYEHANDNGASTHGAHRME